ncbi:MAG: hypothetical protein IPJ69_10460 [Deltaproteobacteria bacterium]|nr:MAG: hypothetical protein IPJ69_10460 [Deltaproteobacteria bacterium]
MKTLEQAPRSFWLSIILAGEVVGLTIFKPIWIFNLFLVGRLVLDFVVPGYFMPLKDQRFNPQKLPTRAPVHMSSHKSVGLG